MRQNGLTPKQAAFVREYLIDKNATQAAIRAGYSRKTARQIGEENLSKPDIRLAIDAGMAESAQRAGLAADEVRANLARVLRFDPRKLFNRDGTMKPIHELDDDTALCLTGIEVVTMAGPPGEDGEEGAATPLFVKKIKWETKSTAMEQAMKMLGMFAKDNRQRPGALEGVPRELLKALLDRLLALPEQSQTH